MQDVREPPHSIPYHGKRHALMGKCQHLDCPTPKRSGGLPFCAKHGGGVICDALNCEKTSQGGGRCRKHQLETVVEATSSANVERVRSS